MRARVTVALFAAVLTCATALPAAAATIVLAPSSLILNVGDSFTVDVNIVDITDLYGFQFDFNFDNALVNPVNPGAVTEGPFLATGGLTFFSEGVTGAGTIDDIFNLLVGAVTGVDGDGTLATLSFTAMGAGSAIFSLSNILLQDSAGNELQDSVQVGTATVRINNSTSTPVPEPASLLLFGTGLTLLARRRVRRSQP